MRCVSPPPHIVRSRDLRVGQARAYQGGALRFGILALPFANSLIRNMEHPHVTHQTCICQSRN
jgi:hypothetical protein